MDAKERFKLEFEVTCDVIKTQYPTKNEQEKEIVGIIINNFLHEVQLDAEKMTYVDFYKKYLIGTLFLDGYDFTNSQKKEIIEESPLNERDRNLAIMYWIDMKSEEDISSALGIDRKTVRNNIPKISMILKQTCAKTIK